MGRRSRAKIIKRFAIGSGLAATAGYVAGILTAPKSGKETRDDIKHVANESITAAEKDLKKLHTELGNAIDDSKKSGAKLSKKAQAELDNLRENAQDIKEKARELISVIHEGGDANDKDLQKAIKDAGAAIDHIRTYLKK